MPYPQFSPAVCSMSPSLQPLHPLHPLAEDLIEALTALDVCLPPPKPILSYTSACPVSRSLLGVSSSATPNLPAHTQMPIKVPDTIQRVSFHRRGGPGILAHVVFVLLYALVIQRCYDTVGEPYRLALAEQSRLREERVSKWAEGREARLAEKVVHADFPSAFRSCHALPLCLSL